MNQAQIGEQIDQPGRYDAIPQCSGPVTAEAAAQCNIETTIVPAQYTISSLVDAIVEHFEKSQRVVVQQS